MAITFDLFGTLVDRVESTDGDSSDSADPSAIGDTAGRRLDDTAGSRLDDPAAAVAAELGARDVAVPDDWADAYRERHIDAPEGAAVPLPAHVSAALSSRGVDAPGNAARRAVVAAFDPAIRTRPGAVEAVAAAREVGPVGLCSNCSVPELVGRTLVRSSLSRDDFDAVVSSVGCGWRKPAPEIFETTAARLGVAPDDLVHIGDEPRTDGGIEDLGGRFVDVSDVPLERLPDELGWSTCR